MFLDDYFYIYGIIFNLSDLNTIPFRNGFTFTNGMETQLDLLEHGNKQD